MTTLYIHVGMEKTGTTSLQRFFVRNRKVFKENGLVYPDLTHYKGMAASINGYFLMRQNKADLKENFDKINGFLKNGQSVLLSAECLWVNCAFEPDFWKMVREYTCEDAEVKMLVYIRRQDAYLYSRWGESIKQQFVPNLNTLAFPEYLEIRRVSKRQIENIDYRLYFQKIEPVLGMDHIIIRTYEKNKDLFSDFLEAIDLQIDGNLKYPEAKNVSVKGTVQESKRLLNHLQGELGEINTLYPYLMNAQKRLEEEGMQKRVNDFPLEKKKEFLAMFKDSNAWLAREYFGRDTLFDESDLEKPEDNSAYADEYTKEDLAHVYGLIILELMHENQDLKEQNEQYEQQIRRNEGLGKKIRKKVKNIGKN